MRVTIIEDNEELASAIADRLQVTGHVVTNLYDGDGALESLQSQNSDLVILDINLPHKNGLEVLQEMRSNQINIPVLLLTARATIEDRVKGLDCGADDYLIKPFNMEELEARIRVLIKRHRPEAFEKDNIGALEYHYGTRQIIVSGKHLELPRRELMLFECLIRHRNQILSKAAIAEHIFGLDSDIEDKSVETYISRLRKRILPFGVTIKVARCLGYMLDEL